MSRLAKSDVHFALERAAGHIKSAAGNDPFISRKDIRQKLKSLSGVERQLTNYFYRFIDHRDHKPGARVTAKDVDEAVAYAKDRLIDQYDLNNNGLSKSEIERMSQTGKFAVQFAKALKQATITAPVDTIEEIGPILEELAKGLYFFGPYTEGEGGLRLITFKIAERPERISPELLAALLNLDTTKNAEKFDIHDNSVWWFHDSLLSTYEYLYEDRYPAMEALIDYMENTLSGITLAVVGYEGSRGGSHPSYWLGIAPDGNIIGFQSETVWT